jgi:hypothetical protein
VAPTPSNIRKVSRVISIAPPRSILTSTTHLCSAPNSLRLRRPLRQEFSDNPPAQITNQNSHKQLSKDLLIKSIVKCRDQYRQRMPYYRLSRTYNIPRPAIYHQLTLKLELAYTCSTIRLALTSLNVPPPISFRNPVQIVISGL